MLLTVPRQTATGRVLVFTRKKRRACSPAIRLANGGFRVSALQWNKPQNRRQPAIDGFRTGKYDVLVVTDIAARGIDVLEISHVINFDTPDTADAYTHRIARTGRANRSGEALTFTARADEAIVLQIKRALGAHRASALARFWIFVSPVGRPAVSGHGERATASSPTPVSSSISPQRLRQKKANTCTTRIKRSTQ